MGVIPVVNENDTVAVKELNFGDNDTLSALVATLVNADHLFLATDVDALYTSNPFAAPKEGVPPPTPMHIVSDVNEVMHVAEGSDSQWGTGGMGTKLVAAQLAAAAGISTTIVHAQKPHLIADVLAGARDVCTTFLPLAKVCGHSARTACAQDAHCIYTACAQRAHGTRTARAQHAHSMRTARAQHAHDLDSAPLRSQAVRDAKRWVIALPPRGELHLDAGASKAVRRGATVFAAGLKPDGVVGDFSENEAVRLMDETGMEFGRGVIKYSAEQARKLCGCSSDQVAELLDYNGPEKLTSELVSRANLAVTAPLASRERPEVVAAFGGSLV